MDGSAQPDVESCVPSDYKWALIGWSRGISHDCQTLLVKACPFTIAHEMKSLVLEIHKHESYMHFISIQVSFVSAPFFSSLIHLLFR